MAKRINYASLYTLRSDGRYQGYWKDPTGKRHTVCDRDPEALYYKILEKESPEEGPLMFSTILDYWERNVFEKLPEGTRASYAASVKRAREWFAAWEVESIYSHDITVRLEQMKNQGKAKSTVNIQKVVLKGIFYSAIIHPEYGKIIRINPVSEVKLPKGLPKQKKREAPEDDIIKKIQDNAQVVAFGDFVLFLMGTGMRRGEALGIQWQDINFETGFITVSKSVSLRGRRGVINEPKTENGIRKVPILQPLFEILKRPKAAKDTDFLFHGEDPSLPMANSCYQRRWNHYCRDMGFVTDDPEERISKQNKRYIVHNYKNTLSAHVLRHGYATMMYECEIPEKEAAVFMGHADEEMLREVYQHLREKKKASAADLLKEKTKHGFVGIGNTKKTATSSNSDCKLDCTT